MTEQQINRIKGVFFGQAIGDALGLGTEFLSKEKIAKYYPDGLFDYSQIVQDGHRKRWQIGDWTDDTDQFLCICDSILTANKVDEKAFAIELEKWFKRTRMGCGRTVHQVVSTPQFTQFPHQAAKRIWEISNRENAANGAIMRTSILGTFQFWDLQAVIENTEKIAKVTHWDSRCVGSCVVVTYIISSILSQDRLPSLEQIIAIGEKYDERIKPFIEKAYSCDISDLYLDEPSSIGYTLKALSAGLWAYFNAPDFIKGILRVVNEGGDADTNACIAGSLLGAKYGFDSIPEKYVEGLRNKSFLERKFNAFIDGLIIWQYPNLKVQKELFIPSDYEKWEFAIEVFELPFAWLKEVLIKMTGFDYPSGYAILSSYNNIVKKIWAGSKDEYPLYREIREIDSCVYIDNYEGPERATYGWKNLDRYHLEKTFNFRFNDKDLEKLGGFPNSLTIDH